jgi:uncharacterized protein (TIRG00374 family)
MPARLGDVARAFLLGKKENVPASTTFSTVMLERVFDGLTVVAILLLVLLVAPPHDAKIKAIGPLVGLGFLSALVVCAVVTWNEARALALAERILKPFPRALGQKAHHVLHKLAQGLHTLRSPVATLEVLLLSLTIWTAEIAVYWVAQHAFGLSVPLLGLALTMSVLSLALIVPSAPGFVGVYEGTFVYAVGLYGIAGPDSVAFALAMHLVHYVPGTLLGLAAAWRSGLHLRDVREAADEDEEKLEAQASAQS